jgi:hypothetical protein
MLKHETTESISTEENRLLARLKCKQENNIKMYFKVIGYGLNLSRSELGTMFDSDEQRKKSSGSIKSVEFLNKLNYCLLLNRDRVLWSYII